MIFKEWFEMFYNAYCVDVIAYDCDLLEKNQSNLIWSKSALEKFAFELHKKIIALENL